MEIQRNKSYQPLVRFQSSYFRVKSNSCKQQKMFEKEKMPYRKLLYNFQYLKCPYHHIFLFSHLILFLMQWTSAKKFSIWIKSDFFYELLKTWKSYFLAVDLVPLVMASTCSELWRRFRNVWLQTWLISLVYYLCKFSFVAKCSFAAFCMN